MVKQILQQAGVTLAQFASELSISRPTLDNYIAAFDNGEKIANGFYQDIFDFLFEDKQITVEEFARRYKYMRDYYGMSAASTNTKTSKLKSGYSQPKGEYEKTLDEIVEQIESDRLTQETPQEIYVLVNTALKNMAPEFLDLVRFYMFYSGLRNVKALEDTDKKRYAVIYRTLANIDRLADVITDDEVDEFVKHATKKDEQKRVRLEQIKTTINDNISQLLADRMEGGEMDSVDVDKLLETIRRELGAGNK